MAARHEPGFGAVLRTLRTTCRLTQEELADRSGLSVRAIRNLEIGRTERPQRQSLALLAAALRLTDADRVTLLASAGHHVPTLGRCELPPDPPELADRDDLIAALTTTLTTPGPRLVLVSGGPGVGRTSVAVKVAHHVRDRFPDGQLYADLDTADGQPMPTDALLGRLLRSLGVAEPPPSRDERAALLRAELASRRVLIVLDNVAAEAQVRPLLTSDSPSAVLMTSRRQLVALPGVRQVRLEPLGLDCAIYLLACLAGFARVRAESGAARAIADACSRRPLALRIAGEWLLARPGRPLADLVALLADRDVLLDRLTVADLSMRASIAAHVAQLRPDERLLLRDLADLDTDRLTPADLCHRLATSEPDLREGLAQLAHANLLTQVGSWYRMDPLVRRYAIEDAGHPRLRAAR